MTLKPMLDLQIDAITFASLLKLKIETLIWSLTTLSPRLCFKTTVTTSYLGPPLLAELMYV